MGLGKSLILYVCKLEHRVASLIYFLYISKYSGYHFLTTAFRSNPKLQSSLGQVKEETNRQNGHVVFLLELVSLEHLTLL